MIQPMPIPIENREYAQASSQTYRDNRQQWHINTDYIIININWGANETLPIPLILFSTEIL